MAQLDLQRAAAKQRQARGTGTGLPVIYNPYYYTPDIRLKRIIPGDGKRETRNKKQETRDGAEMMSGKMPYHPPGSALAASWASLTLTLSSPFNDMLGRDGRRRRVGITTVRLIKPR